MKAFINIQIITKIGEKKKKFIKQIQNGKLKCAEYICISCQMSDFDTQFYKIKFGKEIIF